MANRTDAQAKQVKGRDPQFLISRIVRNRIYEDAYWKEFCFALNPISIVDLAIKLPYVGGTFGGRRRPTKFLCLLLKMLQLEPGTDVAKEYLEQEDNKYLRALGAVYLRMTVDSKDAYTLLEPMYNDLRKLRVRHIDGSFEIKHMDEYVDMLLRDSILFDDIAFPQIQPRHLLEDSYDFPPYVSALEDEFDFDEVQMEDPLPVSIPEIQAVTEKVMAAPDRSRSREVREKSRKRRRSMRRKTEAAKSRSRKRGSDRSRRRGSDKSRSRRRGSAKSRSRRRGSDKSRRRGSDRSRSRKKSDDNRRRTKDMDRKRKSPARASSEERAHEKKRKRQSNESALAMDIQRESKREKTERKRDKSAVEPERVEKKEKKKKTKADFFKQKKSAGASEPVNKAGSGELSVEQANALRASLGLKPLR